MQLDATRLYTLSPPFPFYSSHSFIRSLSSAQVWICHSHRARPFSERTRVRRIAKRTSRKDHRTCHLRSWQGSWCSCGHRRHLAQHPKKWWPLFYRLWFPQFCLFRWLCLFEFFHKFILWLKGIRQLQYFYFLSLDLLNHFFYV